MGSLSPWVYSEDTALTSDGLKHGRRVLKPVPIPSLPLINLSRASSQVHTAGSRVFERLSDSFLGICRCRWRPAQSGVAWLAHRATRQRLLLPLTDFRTLVASRELPKQALRQLRLQLQSDSQPGDTLTPETLQVRSSPEALTLRSPPTRTAALRVRSVVGPGAACRIVG
jgi:hypothetical protein